MEKERTSTGQLTAAAWAAVLAPAVGVLPGLSARLAGAGAWLAPLVALPGVLLLGRMLERQEKDGQFLGGLGRFGEWLLTIIYIVWALLLASARLRLSGQRLLFTARREVGLWFFLPVLAAMALWMTWGKTGAFVRAAAVFSRILTLALVVVLGLTAFQIRPEHLWPIWTGDLLLVLRAAVPALGVLCYGVYAVFLPCERENERQNWRGRAVGACCVLAALQLSVLGNMGAELAGAVEDPFLTLSKHVGVEGAFQRVESLVSALWLLGDLALLGLLLRACCALVQNIVPGWEKKRVAAALTALILAGSGLGFRDALLAQRFEWGVAPLGNLILGLGVPMLLLQIKKEA